MSRHRTGDSRFQISRGVWLTLGGIAVVVVLIVGWLQLGAYLDRSNKAEARRCVSGDVVASVVVDPEFAEALSGLVDEFNKTDTVVRDHCVTAELQPTPSIEALAGLISGNGPLLASRPSVWIPQSSLWSAQLSATSTGRVEGTPRSLVTTPVVLAVPTDGKTDAKTWADAARLPGLALPPGAGSDATRLAIAAALAGRAEEPIRRALARKPRVDGDTTAAALTAVRPGGTVGALPVGERQAWAASRDGATFRVLRPAGPTPQLDYPLVRLSGPWIDAPRSDAAGAFLTFLGEHLDTLRAAGFRGPDGTTTAAPTGAVTFPAVGPTLPAPDARTATRIDALLNG